MSEYWFGGCLQEHAVWPCSLKPLNTEHKAYEPRSYANLRQDEKSVTGFKGSPLNHSGKKYPCLPDILRPKNNPPDDDQQKG